MKKLALLLGLFIASPCYAGSWYAQWGAGIMAPEQDSLGEIKYVEFGSRQVGDNFVRQIGIGGWVDGTKKEGVQNSQYFQWLWGVEVENRGRRVSYLVGPAVIVKTDSLMGSWYHVSHELSYGWVDEHFIGIVLKHYSNAGLKRPNVGRNFIGLKVEF